MTIAGIDLGTTNSLISFWQGQIFLPQISRPNLSISDLHKACESSDCRMASYYLSELLVH